MSLNFYERESRTNLFILVNTIAEDSARITGNKPLKWEAELFTRFHNISRGIGVSNQ